MSDERIDVTLREERPEGGSGFTAGLLGVIPKLWEHLKNRFPLFTSRAGEFVDAKVELARGEADRVHASAARETAEAHVAEAKADLISATAEAIRARTAIQLATLPAENARLVAERDAAASPEALITAATERIRHALAAAEALGITLSLEQFVAEQRALPAPAADAGGGTAPAAEPQVEG
ncbi:hypothetical protein [Longimicrobium sp.]|jgi:hypothetical protein|uniref:hypothetical protein n=1 Tax=Longimicrobium sp. TaxID=2029185 RepID=UPI002ED97570